MQIGFLTNEGLDKKYFQWKDVIINSVLVPVITITDDRHAFYVFASRQTSNLHQEYSKEMVDRIDHNYNRLLETQRVFFVQLQYDDLIKRAAEAGYPPDGIFAVWKDDLLKANPVTCLGLKAIDPKILMKEKMN